MFQYSLLYVSATEENERKEKKESAKIEVVRVTKARIVDRCCVLGAL